MPDRTTRHAPTAALRVTRISSRGVASDDDLVAVEEPLAIRVASTDDFCHLAITMRTPGDDAELAVGWLFAEGLVTDRSEIADVSWCARDLASQDHNAVTVTLRRGRLPNLSAFDRVGPVTSACGVCGKASVDAAAGSAARTRCTATVDPAVLWDLPDQLRVAQETFTRTGGLHAAALFALDGTLLGLREDVGRHNALDKLVGAAVLDAELPWHERILVLSGRASFELLQKAAMTGVGIVCAIGAPSSLAVDMAARCGITLIGFLRATGANVYTGTDRVEDVASAALVASP